MTNNILNIALVQSDLVWENIPANLKMIESKIASISKEVDLVVLPEMFSTGFSMNVEQLAEKMNGSAVSAMKNWAKKFNKAIAGSLIITENNQFYNRLILVEANGTIQTYNKQQLFSFAGEHEFYSAGEKNLIVNFKGWNISFYICYDLRFPEISRNFNAQYDLAIYVANWPETRNHAWKSLLIARAIENQCFVAGVNRIGLDGKNNSYSGDSVIINPMGELIQMAKDGENQILEKELQLQELIHYRQQFPVLKDIK